MMVVLSIVKEEALTITRSLREIINRENMDRETKYQQESFNSLKTIVEDIIKETNK